MKEVCITDLNYATTITKLRNGGASYISLLRWAEQEAEKTAAHNSKDPLLPIGTNLVAIHLIQRIDLDRPIYQKVLGDFPQWVYRSCLKGKPLS